MTISQPRINLTSVLEALCISLQQLASFLFYLDRLLDRFLDKFNCFIYMATAYKESSFESVIARVNYPLRICNLSCCTCTCQVVQCFTQQSFKRSFQVCTVLAVYSPVSCVCVCVCVRACVRACVCLSSTSSILSKQLIGSSCFSTDAIVSLSCHVSVY